MARHVFWIELGLGRKTAEELLAAAVVEEDPQGHEVSKTGLVGEPCAREVREVLLENRASDRAFVTSLGKHGREEPGEPAEPVRVIADRADSTASCQTEASPGLGGLPEPQLADATKADEVVRRPRGETEATSVPGVARVLVAW